MNERVGIADAHHGYDRVWLHDTTMYFLGLFASFNRQWTSTGSINREL